METLLTVRQICKEVYSEVSEKIPDASFETIRRALSRYAIKLREKDKGKWKQIIR